MKLNIILKYRALFPTSGYVESGYHGDIDQTSIVLLEKKRKRETFEKNQTKQFRKILIKRLVVVLIMLLVFTGAVLLRVFYKIPDQDVQHSACVFIDHEKLNQTYIQAKVTDDSFEVKSFDDRLLNETYWFETVNNWNTSFVFCQENGGENGGMILGLANDTNVPAYKSYWTDTLG